MADKINLKDVRKALANCSKGKWQLSEDREGPPCMTVDNGEFEIATFWRGYKAANFDMHLMMSAPAVAEALLKAIEAMQEIAGQKKTDELETEYDVEFASFEDGYDMCIDRARAFLECVEGGE